MGDSLSRFSPNSGFLSEAIRRTGWEDIFLLCLVPFVLIFVFLLPESVQEGFVLQIDSPTFLTVFMTHFVHAGFSHLFNNLTAYFVIVIPAYIMYAFIGRKDIFRRIFLVFLLVFPFILSGLDILVLGVDSSRGFSGIVAAFFGFLPLTIFRFLKLKLNFDLGTSNSVVLFLFAATLIAYIYAGLSFSVALILVLLGLYLWRMSKEAKIGGLRFFPSGSCSRRSHWMLASFAFLVFISLPFSMFPPDPVVGDMAVNILSHYSGFALGFVVPYILLEVLPSVRSF